MGHYASEMTSDAEYERRDRERKERHDELVKKIKKAIKKDGIESVLAEIIENHGRFW